METLERRCREDLTSPESANILAGGLDTGKEDRAESLPSRIARYGRAKERAVAMQDHLLKFGLLHIEAQQREMRDYGKRAFRARKKLEDCGNYLHFRHYYTVNDIRLHAACFCKQHLICPLCAIRRGSKTLTAYLERFQVIQQKQPELKPYLLTFTVRDGDDLMERWEHLNRSLQVLKDRRRRWLSSEKRGAIRRRVTWTEFAKVAGAVGSYEVKRGKGSGLWHPHVHMVALCASIIDQVAIRREWESITGDSFMVDVRPFHAGQDPAEGFMEVFKYAVKFGDLSLADNWDLALFLEGSRLLFSLGVFRGVEVPESLTDEPLDDLPYFDLFYRWFSECGYTMIGEVPPGC